VSAAAVTVRGGAAAAVLCAHSDAVLAVSCLLLGGLVVLRFSCKAGASAEVPAAVVGPGGGASELDNQIPCKGRV
jgi:hypothetical protein